MPNGSEGTWVSVLIEDDETREELRAMSEEELRQATGFTLGQYGQFQKWHECRGCQPRPADYGVLCDQCYTRLRDWLASSHNLAWCWSWLEGDMVPGQVVLGAKAKRGKKDAPPAAMSVTIHDLRQDILGGLGQWLGMVTGEFDLDGPTWWRHRITEARRRQEAISHDAYSPLAEMDWRAWLPQQGEVQDACRFLAGWLTRICNVEDLTLAIYEEASRLHRRVKTVAPWEATAKRLPDLRCPVCDREALVRFEGEESLQCRRCNEIVPRQRYDVWSAGLEQEAGRKAS